MEARLEIYAILESDAKLSSTGTLGALLNQKTTVPYGVYFLSLPEKPKFPSITYEMLGGGAGRFSTKFVTFTAWGVNYNAVLKRIKYLLESATVSLGVNDDYTVYGVKKVWESPVLWDADYKQYTRTDRFEIKCVE